MVVVGCTSGIGERLTLDNNAEAACIDQGKIGATFTGG